MFNNLIKLSNGRTTTKILATLLVITLTFANFALLGSFMIESIAIDSVLGEQNSNTNSQNVKFNAYLDLADTSLREVSKDINSEELMLYVAVSVEGEGKLEKGVIDFSNSNFVLKDNKETYTRNINTITAGNKIVVQLPIVSRRDSNFNLNLLNMISKIKLTGEHIDKNGNITNIDATKEVKIDWNTENITEEQVNVSQEVITNRICKVEGVNKRVVQLLINTNIQDNKAPIKSTKMEIENPVKGVEPEEVKVATYNTASTNGGDSIKFNNNQGSKWNYNVEENKTYIELTNEADNSGNISWQKNAIDELIVTYIYDEQTVINSISSNAKVILELYGKQDKIEKQNNLTLETVQEKGNIVNVQSSINQNIYKGNMYLGQDTEYKTKYDILVSYAMGDNIYIHDSGDKTDLENLSTYYKSTLINKAQAINVLGNEGTIKICKEDGSIISEILLAQENSDEYFTVNYSENVNNIAIETSKPINAGKIEIINVKAIKVLKLEKIDEATKLNVETKLYVKDSEKQDIEESTKQGTANLLEPTTSVDLELNKTSISNQVENELTITAVLNTNNNSNKLFDNPTINIELPKEITEATLLQDVSLLYEDELKIKSSEIKTSENGNKVISISLEGKQTKYDASANIVMYLKVNADKFMADKNAEIKTTCINGEEKVETLDNINIVSKRGILSKNSIIIGENKQETINNNIVTAVATDNSEIKIKSTIINNNGETIANTVLTGSVPEGAVLKSGVVTNLNNASIYYKNASQEWVGAVEDYSAVKEFKIEIGELEQAKGFEIEYILQPTEVGLKEKEIFQSGVNINYLIGQNAKQEGIVFKVINSSTGAVATIKQDNDLIISLKPKVEIDTFNQGQIVTYEVKVTNTGAEALNNVVLSYQIPEGAVYTELTYMQATDVQYTDNAELKNKEWTIENIPSNSAVTKEVTIKINEGTKQIISKANLKNEAGIILIETIAEPIEVNSGEIAVMLSRINNINLDLNVGDVITYVMTIKNNTDTEMKNLQVTATIPENTLWIAEQTYYEEWKYNSEKNTATYNINKLNPNEEYDLLFEVEVDKLQNNSCQDIIESTVIVTTEEGKVYESNLLKNQVLTEKLEISLTSTSPQVLKEGEIVNYIIKVCNTGKRATTVNVIDELPEEVQFRKLTYYISEDDKIEKTATVDTVKVLERLEIDEILTIEIEAVTYELDEEVESKQIKNVAKIDLGNEEYLISEAVINTIVNDIELEEPEEPEEPENPEEPQDPEEPEQPEEPTEPDTPKGEEDKKTYAISGIAWLDEDKNGIKDNDESILQGVEVILLNKDGEIVKDSNNEEIATITTITGTYKFNNLQAGEYIIAFKYDTEKYALSKYQVEGALKEENSDVISKELVINNKTMLVGATDIIKIQTSDIQNIDIGLVQNAKFDLRLEKYVSKVIVTNDQESTTYNFEDAALAKVEIAAKQLEKSSILVQYQIKVLNEGDVDGYVGDIIDYLPKELTFNSEMNPNWYSDSQGNLHNVTLEKEPIKAGESKTVSLVLTKVLNNNSTGTIENLAEIEKAINLQGIRDADSISGNKKDGEDDIASASLIISIKTGSPTLYIGIVIMSLGVLGTGIYLIDKKVLRNQIMKGDD